MITGIGMGNKRVGKRKEDILELKMKRGNSRTEKCRVCLTFPLLLDVNISIFEISKTKIKLC